MECPHQNTVENGSQEQTRRPDDVVSREADPAKTVPPEPHPEDPPRSRKIPLPGLRIIKTALAVLLCLYIDMLRGDTALPFYSAIAAILCMQTDHRKGLKTGMNRLIATLIGGVYGYLLVVFILALGVRHDSIMNATIIGLAIIPLIYLVVLIKQHHLVYLSCVVCLSIALSHGGDPNPLLFAVSRIIDTVIGIVISIGVNAIPFLRNKRIEKD